MDACTGAELVGMDGFRKLTAARRMERKCHDVGPQHGGGPTSRFTSNSARAPGNTCSIKMDPNSVPNVIVRSIARPPGRSGRGPS
jgi:hypothetical protein